MNRILRAVLTAAVSIALSGCAVTSTVMSAKATAYNVAVADASNRLLLLNALRASQRMPTYYTHVAGDTSGMTVQPTYTGQGPIGQDIAKKGLSYLFTLSGSSQDQMTLATLDDQKFMRGVLTPVPLDVLGFFLNQGWPQELLFSMTISKISSTPEEVEALVRAFESECANAPGADYCNGTVPAGDLAGLDAASPYKQLVAQKVDACIKDGDAPIDTASAGGARQIVFNNYPPDHGQLKCFQWMLRVVIALAPDLKSTPSVDVVAQDVPNGNDPGVAIADLLKSNFIIAPGGAPGTYTICKKSNVAGLTLKRFRAPPPAETGAPATGDPVVRTFAATGPVTTNKCARTDRTETVNGTHGALKLQMTTRSLDGMIYFLGEDIRAGRLPDAGPGGEIRMWVWNTQDKRYEDWRLFEVRRGFGPISVSFMGQEYGVPEACPASTDCPSDEKRHASFQAIALLNQVWGLQKEATELPIQPVVTVITP